jgi:uncharacterized protein YaiI (UPF0178 family)
VLTLFIDADACPVKDEVYRVAGRYGLQVYVVSNSWMRTPEKGRIELIVVENQFDAADDWIVDNTEAGDIVVTTDIPLAARCLESGACVLRPDGQPYTEDNIGQALATRELLSQLRDLGEIGGGPPPFQKKDRSRFLQRLDETIQRIRRESGASRDDSE